MQCLYGKAPSDILQKREEKLMKFSGIVNSTQSYYRRERKTFRSGWRHDHHWFAWEGVQALETVCEQSNLSVVKDTEHSNSKRRKRWLPPSNYISHSFMLTRTTAVQSTLGIQSHSESSGSFSRLAKSLTFVMIAMCKERSVKVYTEKKCVAVSGPLENKITEFGKGMQFRVKR